MRVAISLDAETSLALRRLAHERGEDPATTAAVLVREALMVSGMIESEHELDEDTAGEA